MPRATLTNVILPYLHMSELLGRLVLVHAVALGAYLVGSRLVLPLDATQLPRVLLPAYEFLALLNEGTPWYFVPLPLWIITAAMSRRRYAIIAVAGLAACFLWLYGPLFIPKSLPGSTPNTQGATRLRVMTFNVSNLSSQVRPPALVLDIIEEADADLLLLQEISPELSEVLAETLLATYPYQQLEPHAGFDGMGVLSRHPFDVGALDALESRPARMQHVVMRVEGQDVHVVHVHFRPPRPRILPLPYAPFPILTGLSNQVRRDEVIRLVDTLHSNGLFMDHLVVAGDFNLSDQTPEYRQLIRSGLTDAHRAVGWGFGHTWPVVAFTPYAGRITLPPIALIRLDYVLYSPSISARSIRIGGDSAASDHAPLVADLALLPR